MHLYVCMFLYLPIYIYRGIQEVLLSLFYFVAALPQPGCMCCMHLSQGSFSRETTRRAWLAVGKHCTAIGAVAVQTALDLPAFLPSAHWLLLLIEPWHVQRAGPKETAVFPGSRKIVLRRPWLQISMLSARRWATCRGGCRISARRCPPRASTMCGARRRKVSRIEEHPGMTGLQATALQRSLEIGPWTEADRLDFAQACSTAMASKKSKRRANQVVETFQNFLTVKDTQVLADPGETLQCKAEVVTCRMVKVRLLLPSEGSWRAICQAAQAAGAQLAHGDERSASYGR